MVIWIALLCLALVSLVPLGICIRYDNRCGAARVMLGPVCIASYPKRRTGRKKSASAKKKKDSFASHAQVKKRQRGLQDYLPIVRLVLDFLRDFHSKLRVNNFRLKVIFGGSDPSDLSVQYGYAWALTGNVMPLLDRYFIIKKRNVEIECDYTADTTMIDFSLDLSITVGRLLTLGVYHGWKVLRKYLKITNKIKDGATL